MLEQELWIAAKYKEYKDVKDAEMKAKMSESGRWTNIPKVL